MSRPVVALVALAVTAALAGCGHVGARPDAGTVGVVYCGSPSSGHDVERVEYRQGGEVVAAEDLETGTPYRAEVPVGPAVEIFVDGRLVGTAGGDPDDDTDGPADGAVTGGYTALLGDGCPPYEEPPAP